MYSRVIPRPPPTPNSLCSPGQLRVTHKEGLHSRAPLSSSIKGRAGWVESALPFWGQVRPTVEGAPPRKQGRVGSDTTVAPALRSKGWLAKSHQPCTRRSPGGHVATIPHSLDSPNPAGEQPLPAQTTVYEHKKARPGEDVQQACSRLCSHTHCRFSAGLVRNVTKEVPI